MVLGSLSGWFEGTPDGEEVGALNGCCVGWQEGLLDGNALG
jgi:hypothetical protein